jgi:regulator of sirC expression with transglutaminase-like and TPR domain
VKAQLASGGAAALEELRALEGRAEMLAAFHLRDVIADIEERAGGKIFAEFCRTFGEHGDLEKASWALATALGPGEDFSEARAELDAWGAEVKRRLVKAPTALDRVETLAEFLNYEQKLRGNEDDYYEIENSLLPSVIERRLGIPISLALVYQLVARRAGMRVDGVGLPGHFIARHEDVFFDPFHGGKRVGFAECKMLVAQQNLTLGPEHLAPATPRQILVRMLTNIFYVAEQTDAELAEKVSSWIDAVRGRMEVES